MVIDIRPNIERNQFIDALKGLLIFLVVIGHSIQYGSGQNYCEKELFYDNFVYKAIYTFHMPMFMIISGYLFGYSCKKKLDTIVVSRLKSIAIPFVVFCTIVYFVWWYFNGVSSFYLSDYLRKMKINMWFLSSVLFNGVIVALVTHLIKKYNFLILGCLFIFLLFIPDETIYAPHKYMYLYFIVGYWCNSKRVCIDNILNFFYIKYVRAILFLCFVLIAYLYSADKFIYKGGICIMYNGIIDRHMIVLDALRYFDGFVCCLFFLSITRIARKYIVNPLFIFWGKYSLGIYGFQSIAFSLIYENLSCLAYENYDSYLPVLLFIVVTFLSACFVWICSYNRISSMLFLGK